MCRSSCLLFICFCKQKTAYDMRISDWSSDVCSSDLLVWPVLDLHPGLRIPCAAGAGGVRRRYGAVPRAHHQDPVGRDDRDLLHQPRAGAADPRLARLRGPGSAAAAVPDAGCADQRRAAVRVRKTVRSEEHTSELQSLMRISYAVFCLKNKT